MQTKYRTPSEREQRLVQQVRVRPIRSEERPRFMRLLAKHHYLGSLQPVGEQMLYVAVTPNGGWMALLVFAAAAKHLKAREHWIGWTPAQKRKRLSLIVNNVRYLILPRGNILNMGSRVLRLTTDRISADWQQRYGHPLAALETFVNPEQFQGTVYRANGWVELGATSGYGRCARDYDVRHNKPKRLFVKPLYRNAARSLQAEHLKPTLAMVEAKVRVRCDMRVQQIRSLVGHFRAVPDFRQRFESYPLYALHTQQKTAREIVQEMGGDYLLTVKKNQPGIRKTLAQALADIPASFSPSAHDADPCVDRGNQPESARTADA